MIRLLALAFLFSTFANPTLAQRRAFPDDSIVPSLIVFITVDQLRQDYLERFGSQLTGGLARMVRNGAVFTNAHQDHAITETAPGHASTMSGRFPRNTGIVRNAPGVFDPQAPLVEGIGPGASPFRFRGGTLIDWLRSKDQRSRALSVSYKDRGAILPLGRASQDVYWYSANGRFTTSTYYADTLPGWVKRFNARRVPASMAGQSWTPIHAAGSYPEPDSVNAESNGSNFVFPHVLPVDTIAAARAFPGFPWMDELTLDLALEGLQQLKLGAGTQTDIVAIALSATDVIGHRFGPDSKEIHDQILRLDRMLGAFLDSLFVLRSPDKVVVALTADHGVAPFPAVHNARKGGGGSARPVSLAPVVLALRRSLVERGVDSTAVSFEDAILFVDRAKLVRAKVSADSLVRAFAAEVRKVPGVQRVDSRQSLSRVDTARDAVARRWYNALTPDLPAELVVTLAPFNFWEAVGYAQHGSPHDYDSNVPVIFFGRPFRAGRFQTFARVVDMAPTLAWVTATTPYERLDGHVLWQAMK
ncbi:MAG: alkaline phosphatase family protein [Gemmatimonadaceae bacterium]